MGPPTGDPTRTPLDLEQRHEAVFSDGRPRYDPEHGAVLDTSLMLHLRLDSHEVKGSGNARRYDKIIGVRIAGPVVLTPSRARHAPPESGA